MIKHPAKALRFPALQSRALKYGYANARVQAMKGLLLSPSALEEMIGVATLNGMIELLQRTPYRDALTSLAIRYQGALLVELAAHQRFRQIAQKIWKMAPPDDRSVVEVLLKRWDLQMLRLILNARQAGKNFEEIKPYLIVLTPAYRKDFEAVARAEKVEEAFRRTAIGQEVLGTADLSGRSRRSRKGSEVAPSLNQLQLQLQMYLYEHMDRTLRGYNDRDVQRIRRILRKEIDLRNIITIEKLKRKGVAAEKMPEHLLQGGALPRVILDRLMKTASLKETVELVQPYLRKIEWEGDSLTGLEIALEKALALEKVRSFHRSILSVGTLLGLLLLLEEEIHNLRKIAKGKEFGLSEEEVRKTLVTV